MSKNTGAIRHTHKYYKEYDPKGRFRWACMRDGCTHFIPRNTGTPAGKNSICWNCEQEFMLIPYLMDMDNPLCDECKERIEMLERDAEEKIRKTAKPDFMAQIREKSKAGADEIIRRHEEAKRALNQSVEEDQIEVIEPEDTND